MTVLSAHSLALSDVLRSVNLEPGEVLLFRHPLSNQGVRAAVEAGLLREYTAEQRDTFPTHHRYWLVFLGEESNSARFVACYQNHGRGGDGLIQLSETPLLADLAWRLVIDWGPGTRTWRQNGTNAASKPLLSIAERVVETFPGFENVVVSFAQLEQIVTERRRYALWHTALAAVNAIYLIADIKTGKQYVGSAYGDGGLLGRWRVYVETFHGHNKLMVSELEADPSTFSRFQFSILQVLPRTATPDEVITVEGLFKRKLLSREFGLNAN